MNKRQAKKRFKWQADWTPNQRKIYQEIKLLVNAGLTFKDLVEARKEVEK